MHQQIILQMQNVSEPLFQWLVNFSVPFNLCIGIQIQIQSALNFLSNQRCIYPTQIGQLGLNKGYTNVMMETIFTVNT